MPHCLEILNILEAHQTYFYRIGLIVDGSRAHNITFEAVELCRHHYVRSSIIPVSTPLNVSTASPQK